MDSQHTPQDLVPNNLMRQLALKILLFAAITAPIVTGVFLTQDRPYELAIGIWAAVVGLWLMRNALSTTLLVISLLLITFIFGISSMFSEGYVTTALVIVQVPLLLLTMNLNKWSSFALIIGCIALLQGIGFAYPAQVTPAPWSSVAIAILFTTFFTQTLPLIIRNHLIVISEKNAQLDGIETTLNSVHLKALDYAQIGFEITDANNDGKFLYVNTTAAAHSGHTPQELLELSVPEIDPNYPAEKYNAVIQQLHASQDRSGMIETEHLSPDGTTSVPLRINLYLETDEHDQPTRLFSFTQNISEQLEARQVIAKEKDRLEKEVEKRTDELQKLLQVKTEFMANMSHEIRTPMHAIISMSKTLTDELSDPEHHREATVVHRTAKSLLHILDDILDSSKLESGKLLLDPKNIAFETLLSEILEENRSLAKQKHLYLELHNELKKDLWVRVDDNRIRQILKNIIGNAIKFTETGGVTLIARSHHLRDDEQGLVKIELEVKDTGPGIEKETLTRLFNRFEQADNKTSRLYGGTGLGLAIARDLTQMMDGDILVESTPLVGTTFSIMLKLRLGDKQIVTQSINGPLKGHVLIVDDIDVNRMIATLIVKQLGMTYEDVGSGYEALERVRKTHFDAILMDIQMPHIDGLDTTKLIREHESSQEQKRTPIIAVTAHAMAEDREAAIQAGMDDYLTKPFDKDGLRDTLLRNGLIPLTDAQDEPKPN